MRRPRGGGSPGARRTPEWSGLARVGGLGRGRRKPVGVAAATLWAVVLAAGCGPDAARVADLQPLDPQIVQDQDDMTWEDYRPIPGRDWTDPSLVPERGFALAVVALDFPDQPFVVTLPEGSDPFGNPQVEPVPRDSVPRFYADFFTEPGPLNHGQTIHGYWMEQSRGAFGISEVDAFGPYRMPEPLWWYGLNEFGQEHSTPDGREANGRLERDVDSLWIDDLGRDVRDEYDAVLRVYAGYDETGVWQEFGEMKFLNRDSIPPEWGNPDPEMPRWVPTRYVEWTSWLAGAQQWGLSSMRQGENSGTITHELGHFAFRLPDLNNNPYVEPYRRVAAGPWDMMDRGSFNGPGGPHMRWVVPPIRGAAMPAGLMLKNRLETGFVTGDEVLTLSREGLAEVGPAVARITARAVEPGPGTFAGIVVRLDGAEPHDRTPPDDPATNPLSPGEPIYDFYSVEVVQRIGYDSFTPDQGVLLAKNRDRLRGGNGGPNGFNSYIWVIDAHPGDIGMVDYVRPDGVPVMRTIADYRQLNDALFHAGTGSGGAYEWIDPHNGLHFYVVDLERSAGPVLTYTVAVRSTEGTGGAERGVSVGAEGDVLTVGEPHTPVTFTVSNTGEGPPPSAGRPEADPAAADEPAARPDEPGPWTRSDLYRLTVTLSSGERERRGEDGVATLAEGGGEDGWSARLLNELLVISAGESRDVTVYVSAEGRAGQAVLSLEATSESDPAASASASVRVVR